MIALDSSILTYLFNPKSKAPINPNTGAEIPYCLERVQHLIQQEVVIIPSPSLCEVLVTAEQDRYDQILEALRSNRHVRIVPFGTKEAIELAIMQRSALLAKDKKTGSTETWKKVTFDKQIVAIAKVANAAAIYSNDINLQNFARQNQIPAQGIEDIPLPKELNQQSFDFNTAN